MKEFLPYVDTLLRAALNRLHVNSPSLIRLLDVASAFQPKIHQESSTVFDVFNTLVEILADGLRMKTKALPLAIKCLADVSTPNSRQLLPLIVAPADTDSSSVK